MKKLYLIIILCGTFLIGFAQNKDAWTEDFESQAGTGYATGNIDIDGRTWTAKEAGNFDYGASTMGTMAFVINDDKAGAHITSPTLNTCGTVSFKYAYKSGSSSNVFKLQYSTDGSSYADLDTHTLGSSANTSYVNYSYPVNINSATVYIRILSDGQDAHLFIDDYEVTNYNVGIVDPTSFTASPSSNSSIDLSWTKNGNDDDVLLAWTSDGTFGTPISGTSYSSGSSISGGGFVIYNGPLSAFSHIGLTENTKYYYKAWSVDGSTDYSNGVTANTQTLISLPINEGFEGGALPNGWTETIINDVGTDPELTYVENASQPTCSAVEGTKMIHFNSYNCPAGSEIRLSSPPFSTIGVTSADVDFSWFLSSDYSSNADGVTIQWSPDGVNWYDDSFFTRYNPTDTWTNKFYNLPAGALGQNKIYIGFLFHSEYGNNCLLDNIVISGNSVLPEPTNHVLSFTATANGSSQIDLSWNDNDGTQAAENFLIVGKTSTGTYYNPVDATDPSNDTDWSDNNFNIEVSSGVQSYSVTGLAASTNYDFKIYPYTNTGVNIDFKKDGTVPTSSATTDALANNDTEVYDSAPGVAQPSSASISSLKDTEGEAVDVFRMVIEDQGAGDGLATKVIRIRVLPHSTNTASWFENIQGVKLHDGTSYINTVAVTIHNTFIDLHFVSGNLDIADNTSKTLTMSIYLKTSEIVDDAILSFMVDADNHGFASDPSGSGFNSTFVLGDFNSNDFTIDVTATRLKYIQNATDVGINNNMSPSPSVAFTDINGNIDLLLASTANIRLTANGATLIGSPLNQTLDANGLAVFSNVQFSNTGAYVTLSAEDNEDWLGQANATLQSNSFDVLLVGADVFISEVVDPADVATARYVELFNPTSSAIDLSSEPYYLKLQSNGSGSPSNIQLTGTIPSNSAYICAFNDGNDPSNFEDAYGNIWDQENSSWSGNGDDNYYLYKGATLIDMYGVHGEDGTGKDWEYTNSHAVRKRHIVDPNSTWTAMEWVIVPANADQMTPGLHARTLLWLNGTLTSDWNTNGSNNWAGSVREYVPDASDNVTIDEHNFADPIITEFSACNNLIIESGSDLTINAGQGLTVIGTFTNTGQSSLVLNSNEIDGPSSLIHNSNNVPATVNSYFTDLNKWYLVSPPISDATANVFLGQYLDYWDEPNESWVDIVDENTPLIQGKGYSLKKTGTNTAIYTGSLNNGDVILSGLNFTNGTTYEGWNLVGNPYPSVLDFQKIDVSGLSAVAGASVWPHNGTNSSSYLNYSQGGGGNDEARYIQPGQGFMFQLTADNQTITFENEARTHTGLDTFDKSNQETNNNSESLKILLEGENTTTDETYISFRDGATFGFDSYYEVNKLFGAENNPHIFSYINMQDEEKLAIQSFPSPLSGDVVHLGTKIGATGDYQMIFSGMSSFENDQEFLVLDKKTGDIFDIRMDSIIKFYSNNTQEENRFDIVFDLSTDINNSDLITYNFGLIISNDRLYLYNVENFDTNTEVEIYNLLGQKLLNVSISDFDNGYEFDYPSSYYILRLRSFDKTVSKKFYK